MKMDKMFPYPKHMSKYIRKRIMALSHSLKMDILTYVEDSIMVSFLEQVYPMFNASLYLCTMMSTVA